MENFLLSLSSHQCVPHSALPNKGSGSATNLVPSLDDARLAAIVSSVPKGSILVIEDIDCAFAGRSRLGEEFSSGFNMDSPNQSDLDLMKPRVTLSGLPNILDGVASDGGRIVFATVRYVSQILVQADKVTILNSSQTNHADRLDPALLRPGRFDRRIRYELATRKQAYDIFRRLFSDDRLSAPNAENLAETPIDNFAYCTPELTQADLVDLAEKFAHAIPEGLFSTAKLQGYLRNHLLDPSRAVKHVKNWVKRQRAEKLERDQTGAVRALVPAPTLLLPGQHLSGASPDTHATGLPTPSTAASASLSDTESAPFTV